MKANIIIGIVFLLLAILLALLSSKSIVKDNWLDKADKIASVVALIVAIVSFINPFNRTETSVSPRSQQTVTMHGGENNPVIISETARDVYTTFNYNVLDTATRDAVELLKKKSEDTDVTIKLTREEVLLLSKAFQDLDYRTSGLQKLPDGRTQFGHLISGEPKIVIQELNAAQMLFKAGDYNNAFEHSQRAIKAYEDTQKLQLGFRTGDLQSESIAILYGMGALTAQRLQKHELAHQYATKVMENQSTPVSQELLATTLVNIGKVDEAMVAINKAVEADPNNKDLLQLKDEISKKVKKP